MGFTGWIGSLAMTGSMLQITRERPDTKVSEAITAHSSGAVASTTLASRMACGADRWRRFSRAVRTRPRHPVRHDTSSFDSRAVVERASSHLDECRYRLLTNNCERRRATAQTSRMSFALLLQPNPQPTDPILFTSAWIKRTFQASARVNNDPHRAGLIGHSYPEVNSTTA